MDETVGSGTPDDKPADPVQAEKGSAAYWTRDTVLAELGMLYEDSKDEKVKLRCLEMIYDIVVKEGPPPQSPSNPSLSDAYQEAMERTRNGDQNARTSR